MRSSILGFADEQEVSSPPQPVEALLHDPGDVLTLRTKRGSTRWRAAEDEPDYYEIMAKRVADHYNRDLRGFEVVDEGLAVHLTVDLGPPRTGPTEITISTSTQETEDE